MRITRTTGFNRPRNPLGRLVGREARRLQAGGELGEGTEPGLGILGHGPLHDSRGRWPDRCLMGWIRYRSIEMASHHDAGA
jgi:hypothetical protein